MATCASPYSNHLGLVFASKLNLSNQPYREAFINARIDEYDLRTGRYRPCGSCRAMTLRRSFRPFRPDLDRFLFAAVGDEINGMPLSVVSALTRLGLDPWEEASRLSSLSRREAAEQLARLIVELPGSSRTLAEAREIAGGLVNLLPKHDASLISAPQIQNGPWFCRAALPKPSTFLVICFILAAVALASALIHGGFPFGIGNP
jgi:hypothetical protein